MASIQSMVKKCRFLEEKEKWKDLSETYDEIGRMFTQKGRFKEALEYHTKDKEVCEKTQDIPGQAQGDILDCSFLTKTVSLLLQLTG